MTTPNSPKFTPLQNAAISRKLVEAEIVSRAWEDESFRQSLEADPKAALTAAGLNIPEGFRVIVKDEAMDTLQVVLPPKPEGTEELEDGELRAVAGGTTFTVTLPKDGKPRDENAARAEEFFRQVNKAIYSR